MPLERLCGQPGGQVTCPPAPWTRVRRVPRNVDVASGDRPGPPASPSGWHGALYPEDDDTPLLLDRSAFLPACAPPGKSILDLLIGRGRAKELIPLADDEIERGMLGAARRKAPPGSAPPGDNEGLFYRVYRWEEALCMGHPGCRPRRRGFRGSSQGALTTCFWRATTWASRRSTARSRAVTGPRRRRRSCWRRAGPSALAHTNTYQRVRMPSRDSQNGWSAVCEACNVDCSAPS